MFLNERLPLALREYKAAELFDYFCQNYSYYSHLFGAFLTIMSYFLQYPKITLYRIRKNNTYLLCSF